jgi:type 1 glutamine amidotransferase
MVEPHPNGFRANLLKRVDVLVLYDSLRQSDEAIRQTLRAFVEAGKGVVILHHALVDFQDWHWWGEEVMGGRYLFEPFKGQAPSTFKHGVDLDVKVETRHPVTAGVESFSIHDETYKSLWISPKAKVLLRVDHPTSDGPVAWISPYDKARVVVIQLGHGPEAHRNENFRKLVLNAILWAAPTSAAAGARSSQD